MFSSLFQASHGDDNDDASTDYPSEDENEQDGPLDLTVDVLDLRKRRAEETNNAAAAAVAAAAAAAAASAADNKPVFVPPYFGSAYGGASLAGLPFFYPGLGGASYSAFLESKLAEMGNPAMDLSALALAAELHHDAIRQVQGVQTKINPSLPAGLLMPAKNFAAEESRMASAPIKAELKKASGSSAPVTAPSSAASVASAHLTSEPVKMVLKNGVLVKKQKQRRYRTERPFGCDHCTARFTLRSNMERHIKQQHPDVWSTRPRGHRRSACSLTPKSGNSSAPPTTVDPAKLADSKAPISDQVRMAIAQQLKLKRSGEKRQSDENGQSDDEDGALVIDEAKEMAAGGAAAATPAAPAPEGVEAVKSRETADLASVSKLLNNVAQNFQHYFQSHPEEVKASASEAGTDDADDAESNESGSDGPSGSDYGGTRSDGGQVTKKKSAYSNAPHRVSCPYCSRKFPWTSSLRRHILTHTGQKPYKCPQCPLWFTTKSNCDRHLLRKHGNNNDTNNSRNVPDRPYKCALCPSSTFATSDNLKKHVDNKHCPGHSSAESHDAASDEDTKPRPESPSPAETAEASASSAASGELPFKCHLCDEGYAERPEVLNHLQQQHADEFQALISKGALDSGATAQGHTSDEGEDADSARGKFPDYLNRKVLEWFEFKLKFVSSRLERR